MDVRIGRVHLRGFLELGDRLFQLPPIGEAQRLTLVREGEVVARVFAVTLGELANPLAQGLRVMHGGH